MALLSINRLPPLRVMLNEEVDAEDKATRLPSELKACTLLMVYVPTGSGRKSF